MVLNKRERTTAIVAGSCIGALLLYYLAIDPFMAYREQAKKDLATAQKTLTADHDLQKNKTKIEHDWNAIVAAGFNSSSGDTLNNMSHIIPDWVNGTGITNLAMKSDSSLSNDNRKDEFLKVGMHVTCVGRQQALVNFLWHTASTASATRITALQVTPRKEATDDLSIQINLAAVCLNPDYKPTKPAAVPNGGTP